MAGLTATSEKATLGNSPKRRKGKPRMGRQRVPIDPKSYSGRIAAQVLKLREAKGVTVAQMADALGVSEKAVYKWEQGARDIPADKYPEIAKVLGVSAEQFFPKFPRA